VGGPRKKYLKESKKKKGKMEFPRGDNFFEKAKTNGKKNPPALGPEEGGENPGKDLGKGKACTCGTETQ